MIKISITFAILSLILSFLMCALGEFPLATTAVTDSEHSNAIGYGPRGMEQVGDRFEVCYKDIINDIASFQDDPSLERAEARKEAFTGYAGDLADRYKGLAEGLGERLDSITGPMR